MGLFFTAIIGLLAGFVNGLLGTGGGIILVFALNKILKTRIAPDDINDVSNKNDEKDAFAMSLSVTTVLSGISLIVYFAKGKTDISESIKYGISAIPGGIVGAYLLDKLKVKIVKIIFGLLIIWAGINMTGIIA